MPLIEALGGAVVRVKTLDGRELLVKAPEGRVLKPGETVVVHGEGMVNNFFFLSFFGQLLRRGYGTNFCFELSFLTKLLRDF